MAGGIDWFRWHHGSVTDPKFQLVARKSGVRLPDVLAVWAFVLEKASSSDERGAFGEIDCESVDCLFGLDEGKTAEILGHMEARCLISCGAVSSWDKRQPKREREDDKSTSRVQELRKRQKEQEKATECKETQSNASETPCNDMERTETPREEERRVEKRVTNVTLSPLAPQGLDLQAWQRWIDYRKAIKKPIKPASVDAAQAELAKHGDQQAAVVEQSVANGWQGLFELRAQRQPSASLPSASFRDRDEAARRRRWEEMTGQRWPGGDANTIDAQAVEPPAATMERLQ